MRIQAKTNFETRDPLRRYVKDKTYTVTREEGEAFIAKALAVDASPPDEPATSEQPA